jgi:hypothetical protein
MTLSLPEPIANYFAADMAGDSSALARCFTADGTVRDEGGTYTNVAAIQQWNTQAKATYHYTVEPLSVNALNGEIVVTARLSGNFPGSPITVQYAFRIAGNKIHSLEIR